MKTLFILVSIIALSYLALQTSIVKTYMAGFSNTFESAEVIDNAPTTPNSGYEALNAKFSMFVEHSEQESDVFTQRISALEKHLELLENSTKSRGIEQDTIPIHDPTAQQKILQQKEIASHPEFEQQMDLSKSVANKEPPVAAKEANTSQQQKRIQQQAVLRALSQKMELAALNSLVN